MKQEDSQIIEEVNALDDDVQFFGYKLLQKGFKEWFLYMFRLVEGQYFQLHPIHEELLDFFEKIYNQEECRANINLPPRSSKTTLCKYFIAYSMAKNPKCNFIYTSYSQELLMVISHQVAQIMEHPVYKAMYQGVGINVEEYELDPIDSFWKDYLFHNEQKNKYSARKIITREGGLIVFASMGSALTGFGVGIRGAKGFTGALLIDDANKPSDINSENLRNKVHIYFTETLLSRLNNSNSAIVNVQQRLHLEDLTGYLIDKYGFKTFKYPLVTDGKCILPNQYTPARIQELKKDMYVFTAQYQQEPIMRGGNLIKTEWFQRYDILPERFDTMYIVCDTAFTEKQSADNSVFALCGTVGDKLYWIDMYCKKVIFPDLKRDLVSFYESSVQRYGTNNTVASIFIENKGSGISLIQELREKGLPISEIYPTIKSGNKDIVKDKYTRFLEVSSDLESGYVYIPSERYGASWLYEFLKECEAFTGGKQNYKDDVVDCLLYSLKVRRRNTQVDWGEVKNAFKRYI